MRTVILRRGLVALFAAAVSLGVITQAQAETLRIGYQKYGTLVLLKAKGTLEKNASRPKAWTCNGPSSPAARSCLKA
nr:hypothetical protein GCM10020185_37210 [Pseudomonas brassicacearum subsp. brassicacearum]